MRHAVTLLALATLAVAGASPLLRAGEAPAATALPGGGIRADKIASMIELARVFNAGPPLQRSLLFLATTAEEKGLLGAML